MHRYYLEHAEEESGHEEWLLNDLASFGIARDQVSQRLPYPTVAALVGVQYYWMIILEHFERISDSTGAATMFTSPRIALASASREL